MNSFEDIRFEENGKQLGLYMPGHYWVPKAEIELVWNMANAYLPEIDWTKRVCTETFFTTEIWKQFKKPIRFMLGRCLKYFSVHGILPIEVSNPDKSGKRYYRRRQ